MSEYGSHVSVVLLSRDRETLRENFLKLATEYRNTYIDDLPEELVTREDPNYHWYKCRTAFFTAVCLFLGLVLKEGFVLDEEVKAQAVEFVAHYSHKRPKVYGQRRVQSEIDHVNSVLDAVVTELKRPTSPV